MTVTPNAATGTPAPVTSTSEGVIHEAATAVQHAAQTVEAAEPTIAKALTDPAIAPTVERLAGTVPKKVRVWIHSASGVLGLAATVGGAVAAYLTGDAAIAVGGAVGIIGVVESVLSLSHLSD